MYVYPISKTKKGTKKRNRGKTYIRIRKKTKRNTNKQWLRAQAESPGDKVAVC